MWAAKSFGEVVAHAESTSQGWPARVGLLWAEDGIADRIAMAMVTGEKKAPATVGGCYMILHDTW